MAGKRKGFLGKLLGEPEKPITDADRDRWLAPDPADMEEKAADWERAAAKWGDQSASARRPSAQSTSEWEGAAARWGGQPAAAGRPVGVDVVDMAPESPLGKAGIEEGDVITAVNGTSTPTESSLAEALTRLGPGERAQVSIVRDDSPMTITVTAPS